MLLRGVRFDRPALDQSDISDTATQARRSGRSHGGAPLRDSYDGNPNNFNRNDGRPMNYASDRPNPFAGHLPQGYVPPPHIASRGGGDFRGSRGGPPPLHGGPPPPMHQPPPPPMGYQPPQFYGQPQHYIPPPPQQQGYGYGRGPPPPPDYYRGRR